MSNAYLLALLLGVVVLTTPSLALYPKPPSHGNGGGHKPPHKPSPKEKPPPCRGKPPHKPPLLEKPPPEHKPSTLVVGSPLHPRTPSLASEPRPPPTVALTHHGHNPGHPAVENIEDQSKHIPKRKPHPDAEMPPHYPHFSLPRN